MKAISITAMIFAVAAAFAVGWLTGSHAGYTAGAESEPVRIDARATLPVLSWQWTRGRIDPVPACVPDPLAVSSKGLEERLPISC